MQEEEALQPVPVVLGQTGKVQPVASGERELLIDKSLRQSVTREVKLEQSVTAPVSAGQRLGTLTVRAGEEVLAEVPLVAENAVLRLSVKDLAMHLLRRICMGG